MSRQNKITSRTLLGIRTSRATPKLHSESLTRGIVLVMVNNNGRMTVAQLENYFEHELITKLLDMIRKDWLYIID